MSKNRILAGISCVEILEELSNFVSGELSPEKSEMIKAHLAQCHYCEDFGGHFSTTLEHYKKMLSSPRALSDKAVERLAKTLEYNLES